MGVTNIQLRYSNTSNPSRSNDNTHCRLTLPPPSVTAANCRHSEAASFLAETVASVPLSESPPRCFQAREGVAATLISVHHLLRSIPLGRRRGTEQSAVTCSSETISEHDNCGISFLYLDEKQKNKRI